MRDQDIIDMEVHSKQNGKNVISKDAVGQLAEVENQLSVIDGNTIRSFYPVDRDVMTKALERTSHNLVRTSKRTKIFQRAHSNYGWRALVMTHEDDLQNIRQICAELDGRAHALIYNKFAIEDRILEAEELDAEADALDEKAELGKYAKRPAKREWLRKTSHRKRKMAASIREQTVMSYAPILGCLKDIDCLTNLYDELEKKILGDGKKFDEETFEMREPVYWVKRLLYQSFRDIREKGRISKGEQQALEQVGIDPLYVSYELTTVFQLQKEYLERFFAPTIENKPKEYTKEDGTVHREEVDGTTLMLDDAITKIAESLSGAHTKKLIRMGLANAEKPTMLYKEEVGK